MYRKWIVSAALGFIPVLGLANVAVAQVSARFVPTRPAISPYFAYSAFNTTGLPNYYAFVLPAQQQAQQQARFTMLTQAARGSAGSYDNRMALNDEAIGEILDRQLRQRLTTGVGAPVAPATFQNYSHYYTKTPPGRLR